MSPYRTNKVHHRSDWLIIQKNAVLIDRLLRRLRRGLRMSSLCDAFRLTWSMWCFQVSPLSRFTPRYRAVSTLWISPIDRLLRRLRTELRTPSLCDAFCITWSMWCFQVSPLSRVTPDIGLFRPIGSPLRET